MHQTARAAAHFCRDERHRVLSFLFPNRFVRNWRCRYVLQEIRFINFPPILFESLRFLVLEDPNNAQKFYRPMSEEIPSVLFGTVSFSVSIVPDLEALLPEYYECRIFYVSIC